MRLKHKALWIAVGAGGTAALVMGIVFFAFAAAEVDGSTNYSGIALVIVAIGTMVSTILGALATWKASNAERQSVATHAAVNSRMDEFKRMFEEKYIALGELKEKTAEDGRKAAAAQATADAKPEASRVIRTEGTNRQ